MAQATIIKTQDHQEIKSWITEHSGTPARLAYDSSEKSNDPITVWFREEDNPQKLNYQELDWDEFFSIFDHYNYTFHYEKDGDNDRFFKIATEQ